MRAQRGSASGLFVWSALLALAGCGGGGGGGNDAPRNITPTADAGADQTVMRNAPVTLDGTGSADADGDALSYRWVQTGGATVTLSTNTPSRPTFTAPNDPGDLTFSLTTNDGKANSTADTVTITVIDSPPVISALTPPPTALSYGDTGTFAVTATDPDGDPIPGYEVAYGPAGFNVTPQGDVSWTSSGPLFDRVTDFNWGVRIVGHPTALLTGTIEVTDATREYPFRRTNLSIPVQYSGLRVADLDGDGDSEMLIGAPQSLYVLSRSGADYQQSWVYPFGAGAPDSYGDELQAVTSADVDGDSRQEIFFSKGGEVVRLDGASRREAARADFRCRGLEVADLDGNGTPELVCLRTLNGNESQTDGRIVVLDARSLAEIWSTAELGVGRSLAVGNVDADPALEIVTSAGLVYDGVTHENQWNYGNRFGFAVDTGDLDGDGVEEIISIGYWSAVRAYSAVSNSVLWEFTALASDLYSITIADANGDGHIEAVIGGGFGGDVAGVGYNTATHQPELLWQIDPQDDGVSSIAVGDVDADGANEVVWGAGLASSLRDQIVIAGFTPVISVKWQSANIPMLVGEFYGGELARIGGGATRLMFATSRSDSFSGMRAITMTTNTGEVESSALLGSGCCSSPAAIKVVDYNNDNIDELFFGNHDRFGVYDIAGASIAWQAQPQSPPHVTYAVKHDDVNGDGFADLVGLTDRGSVEIHDVHAQSLLWRSGVLGSSAALALSDLDNDGDREIIVAVRDRIVIYGRESTGTTYAQLASVAHENTADVVAADMDGDGDVEIYAVTYAAVAGSTSVLSVFDTNLQLVRSIPLNLAANALFIEKSPFARKNLLLAVDGEVIGSPERSALWAIDPLTATEVWRSPPLVGNVTRDSLHYVDVDGDGDDELVFGGTYGMSYTR